MCLILVDIRIVKPSTFIHMFPFLSLSLIEKPVQWEDKNLAPWGSETQEDVVIDTKLLKAALKRVRSFMKLFLAK